MDNRTAKILWGKSGCGSDVTRITLPISWVRKIGATKDDREMCLSFDEETGVITMTKKIVESK